jgi:hypothetical protein
MPVQGADPSVYSSLGANTPNMLGMIGQFAGAQNQLNQNQLFQQTIRARQALGPLMQQAVDPQTGLVDYNKAGLLVSTNPDTAFMAPDILNQFAQKQLIQSEIMKTNLDNFAKKQSAIGAAAYGLSQEKGDTVQPKDVMSKLTELMAAHGIEAPDAVAYIAGISGLKGPELNAHLKQLAQSSLRGGELASNIDYRPDAFHDGNGNPVPGFINKMQGSAQPSTGPGMPTGAPPASVSAAPGAGPFQAAGGGGPSAAAPPAPAQTPPQLTQTGVGPQRQAALADASAYGKDVNERTNSANQLLLTMQQAQRYLKNFTPGGGEAFRSDLGQLAQAAGMPKATLDAISSGDLSSVQAARKMFFGIGSQIAAQLIHAGGGRMTQTEWGKTLTEGAPNIDLDPGAISKIMTSMRELAHVTNMESDHYRGRQDQARLGVYDMANVQNDWAKTFNQYLEEREDK